MLNSGSMWGVPLQGRSNSASVVRFGTYEVDLHEGVLRKNGMRLRLQGQPFHVLSILLQRAGEIVPREDLREEVWPLDTFVDFDHALNTAVKKVRAALGDDADNPRFVETVPRRGYRFIAPVEQALAPVPAVPATPMSARPTQAHSHRIGRTAVLMAIALAALGTAWKIAVGRRSSQTSLPVFHRLTFDLAELGDARFAPDGATVVFSAGWTQQKSEIYTQRMNASVPQSLGISGAALLSVSRDSELAVFDIRPNTITTVTHEHIGGVLGRVLLGSGSPRELLPDVEAADWSADGQLAVVRQVNGKSRLEFPVGYVLYENSGWISDPRFSPKGDLIAFLDHPGIPDDRGYVSVVDLRGKVRKLSGLWESERGLAWSPRGDEVWFAAARSGLGRELYAVTLSGDERRVLSVAGGLTLKDIAHDGSVLLSRDNERLGILFTGPGDNKPRDISWLDWSLVADITPDGKKILFDEEGENSGTSYQVGLRSSDGSPPVILGVGYAQSLSPDEKWALSVLPAPNEEIVMLPTGAGTPKRLDRGPIDHYQFTGAQWFPDGKQIVFAAYESGQGGARCYVQSVEGGNPRPITPEGMLFCRVAPDARLLAVTEDFRGLLYGTAPGSQPAKEFKFDFGEIPIGWSADAKFLYLTQIQDQAAAISRLEVRTGRRRLWKTLPLPESHAALKYEAVAVTPDGRSFAYTYTQSLSDLYLVRGLK